MKRVVGIQTFQAGLFNTASILFSNTVYEKIFGCQPFGSVVCVKRGG